MTVDILSEEHILPPTPEITPPTLYTEFPMVIDNTAREQYTSCPTRFFHSSVQKIRLRHRSPDLEFGGAFAAGLETLRKAYYVHKYPADEALSYAIYAATKFFGTFQPPENHLKNYDRLIGGLVAYTEKYPLYRDHIRPAEFSPGFFGIEYTFALPIAEVKHPETGDPILYAGRLDMFAEYNGALYVFDDKTTGQLGSRWARQWDTSAQLTGYCWAAQQAGYPVVGAIIRGQSILKSHYEFAENIQFREPWRIGQWYEQLVIDLKNMIRDWERQRYDKRLNSACNQYSGCPYTKLCFTRFGQRWLETDYTNHNWNPTHKNPEGEA